MHGMTTRTTFAALFLGTSLAFCAEAGKSTILDSSDPSVRAIGRTETVKDGVLLEWPGTGAQVAFSGTSCKARIRSTGAVLRVTVDGSPRPDLRLLVPGDTVVELANGLRPGPHLVEIGKRTEASVGTVTLQGFMVDGAPGTLPPPPERRVEVVGNSITCGYGVLDSAKEHHFDPLTQDVYSAWAFVAGRALGADVRTTCVSGRGLVRNYDQSTSGILPELFGKAGASPSSGAWDFALWKPHAVVVNLGTNDFSAYPVPDSAAWEDAVVAFVGRIRKAYGKVPVVLADGPMLSDWWPNKPDGKPFPTLTTVRRHLENAAKRMEGVSVLHLSPNEASRGYGADWHPNRAQAELNGQELAKRLSELLGWNTESRRR
jgi:hypothetical protein